jgi:hypothetical protein
MRDCATSSRECRESGYYGFLRLPSDVLSPLLALALAPASRPTTCAR